MIKNFINDDRKGILSGYPNIVRRAKGNAHNTGKEGLLLQDFGHGLNLKKQREATIPPLLKRPTSYR